MSLLVTLPVVDVVSATPRSRILTLQLDVPLPFAPGQAIVVGSHGQPDRRPYSIACSPERAMERGALELLVGVDGQGSPGPHLGIPRAGLLVDCEGPLGTFVFPDTLRQGRLLFVAGGSGIAPLRSMIDHALRRQLTEQISLLYSARRGDEFAFLDELRVHARHGRIELHPTVTRDEGNAWDGRRGRIGRSHFEAVLHEPSGTLCFVCGPPLMVTETVATLCELGVPRDAIRTEQWVGERP